jgi:Zn-dependent peptidase ImmA (M78 family)
VKKIQLKPEIQEYIKQLTEGLYKGYALQLESVCNELKVKCYLADFDDKLISGAIMKNDDNDQYSIYVAKQQHPNRQRFTIAHELGHYISFLKQSFSYQGLITNKGFEDYAIMFRTYGDYSEAEAEANQIAAEMLMPTEKVKALIDGKTALEDMAELFFVSPIAMAIRLDRLYGNEIIIT